MIPGRAVHLLGRLFFTASCWVLASMLAGCGTPEGSETSLNKRTGKMLSVRSPALPKGGSGLERIPRKYRCKEEAIWFPLEWSEVPSQSRDLAVVISVNRITRQRNAVTSALDTAWVIGGLDPGLRSLQVGNLPKGAFIKGHRGGPDCPPKSRESGMIFAVYAIPSSGFHPTEVESINLATVKLLADSALASGWVAALYGSAQP
jgi:hypothetical protein